MQSPAGQRSAVSGWEKLGIGRLFGPGTDTREIVKYLQEEIPRRRPR